MPASPKIITVSLNPAIDRVIEVENFTLGAHQVGREVRRTPGGKALNVSRVLAALGVENVATGFLGAANRSEFAPAVDNPLIADEFFTLPGRTRENVTIADPATGLETHVRDAGLAVSGRNLDRLDRKLTLLARPDGIVVFSGSLPPGIAPAEFARLVSTCQKAGARVAVDTAGEALRAMAAKMLWLVKPNAAELSEFLGKDLPDLDSQLSAVRRLTSRFEIVLFTRGAEGAYLFTSQLALKARAPLGSGQVRNTVGCGDALLGAFIAGVRRGQDVRQAFAEAVACATASACNVAPAEFENELFEELKGKVEVTEL